MPKAKEKSARSQGCSGSSSSRSRIRSARPAGGGVAPGLLWLAAMSRLMLSWSGLYFGIKFARSLAHEREAALAANAMAHQAQLKMLRDQWI